MKTKTLLIVPIVAGMFLASCGSEEEKEGKEEKEDKTESKPEEKESIVFSQLPEGWAVTDQQGFTYLALTDSVTQEEMESGELSNKFGQHFGAIFEHLKGDQSKMRGAPFSHWLDWNPEGYSTFEAGIPVAEDVEPAKGMNKKTLEPVTTLEYHYYGPYAGSGEAHEAIEAYFQSENPEYVSVDGPWEIYVTDPGEEPDTSKWETMILYPVQKIQPE